MKSIVIGGAGPIGLYAALRLAKFIEEHKLDTTVTIVDHRVGKYTRKKLIALASLDRAFAELNIKRDDVKSRDETGAAIYISDFEEVMMKAAEKHNILFVEDKIKDITPEGIVCSDEKKPRDFSLLCDGTGSTRFVVHKTNATHPDKKPFHVERVGDNPIVHHVITTMTLDEKSADQFYEKLKPSPLERALALEKLRALGWPHFIEPEFNYRKSAAFVDKDGVTKYNYSIFYEIGPTEVDQQEWLNALIQFKMQNAEILLDAEKNKIAFSPFIVDPHRVVESHFLDDGRVRLPIGDAQIDPDHRLGIGILSGISRINALMNAIRIGANNEVEFNFAQYEAQLEKAILIHKNALEESYALKKEAIINALERQAELYEAALSACENASDRKILQQGLDEIYHRHVEHYLLNFQQQFSSLSIKKVDTRLCEHYLGKAVKFISVMSAADKERVEQAYLQLAEFYKNAGNQAYHVRKCSDANQFYFSALEFLKPLEHASAKIEILKIYSNLVLVAIKNKKYEQAVNYADKILAEEHKVAFDKKNEFFMKVKYNKCMALLEDLTVKMMKKGVEKNDLQSLFLSIQKQFDELRAGFKPDDKSFIILAQKFQDVSAIFTVSASSLRRPS